MSRVGKYPVELPAGVEVAIVNRVLQAKGKLGAGVTVLMRYTLRLLTLDQLSRAAGVVCALELMRGEDLSSRLKRERILPLARVADIINKMERGHIEDMLKSLSEKRPKSAEVLKELLFTFDDVVNLAPRARTMISRVCRGVPEPMVSPSDT